MHPTTSQRYTDRVRRKKNRDLFHEPFWGKIQRKFESVVRQTLYRFLRSFFHNKSLEKKINIREMRSILIVPYGDAIGDLIAATPIWHAIKRRAPNCRIGVFTSPRNESLVQRDPDIDHTYSFSGRRNLNQWPALRRAKKDEYEVLLNLHLTHQTDYGIFANLIAPAGIKITGAHPRRSLYNIFFNYIGQRDRHTTNLPHYSLELLAEAVAFDPPLTLSDCRPRLVIPLSAATAIEARTKDIGDFVVLHLQAATPFREWGIDNALRLARQLLFEMPRLTVLLTGSPLYLSPFEHRISSENDSRIRTFESENLLELAALIGRASLVVSPETSIPHFASAMQTPVVVLLPDRDKLPVEWLPVATTSRLLAPATRGEPVATIPVENVFDAVRSILNGSWTQTQTSLDLSEEPLPSFQRIHGNAPLSDFTNTFDPKT
jgi:ADP-heptose:LPS heptosyltransferase